MENDELMKMAMKCSGSFHGESSSQQKNDDNGDVNCGGMRSNIIIPPGYRFCPTDIELVRYYLASKLRGEKLDGLKHIEEVNIYEYSPMEIAEKYPLDNAREWYFYQRRHTKYPKGQRTGRSAKGGYWKASSTRDKIRDEQDKNKVYGQISKLCFHTGRQIDKNTEPTEWLMHEYTCLNPHDRLNEWVLVKIYNKKMKSNAAKNGINLGHLISNDNKNATNVAEEFEQYEPPHPQTDQAHINIPPLQVQTPPTFEEVFQNVPPHFWTSTPVQTTQIFPPFGTSSMPIQAIEPVPQFGTSSMPIQAIQQPIPPFETAMPIQAIEPIPPWDLFPGGFPYNEQFSMSFLSEQNQHVPPTLGPNAFPPELHCGFSYSFENSIDHQKAVEQQPTDGQYFNNIAAAENGLNVQKAEGPGSMDANYFHNFTEFDDELVFADLPSIDQDVSDNYHQTPETNPPPLW